MIKLTNRYFSTQILFFISVIVSLLIYIFHNGAPSESISAYFPGKSQPSATSAAVPATETSLGSTNANATSSANSDEITNPLLTKAGINNLILEYGLAKPIHEPDYHGLKRFCWHKNWQPGVYFSCVHNVGGLINARNMVLNCIRYGLATGARGLILPKIEIRDQEDLTSLRTGKFAPLGHFFNESWLRGMVLTYCPRMQIFKQIEDIPGYSGAVVPNVINIKQLVGLKDDEENFRNSKIGDFRAKFDEYLKNVHRPTKDTPIVIRLDDKTLYSFPPSHDNGKFGDNFGSLLQFRLDLVGIAEIVLERIQESLTNLVNPNGTAEAIKSTPGFLGVHLRTEPDVPETWPKFEELGRATLKTAKQSGLKLIYAGTDDAVALKKLQEGASSYGITVVDKFRMLTENEKGLLQRYSFDQRAIVDFLVLMEAERFVGSYPSSFSTNIALRREWVKDKKRWHGESNDRNLLVGFKFEYLDMMWP